MEHEREKSRLQWEENQRKYRLEQDYERAKREMGRANPYLLEIEGVEKLNEYCKGLIPKNQETGEPDEAFLEEVAAQSQKEAAYNQYNKFSSGGGYGGYNDRYGGGYNGYNQQQQYDRYGNPIQQYDRYGNPIQQYDRYGNPINDRYNNQGYNNNRHAPPAPQPVGNSLENQFSNEHLKQFDNVQLEPPRYEGDAVNTVKQLEQRILSLKQRAERWESDKKLRQEAAQKIIDEYNNTIGQQKRNMEDELAMRRGITDGGKNNKTLDIELSGTSVYEQNKIAFGSSSRNGSKVTYGGGIEVKEGKPSRDDNGVFEDEEEEGEGETTNHNEVQEQQQQQQPSDAGDFKTPGDDTVSEQHVVHQ